MSEDKIKDDAIAAGMEHVCENLFYASRSSLANYGAAKDREIAKRDIIIARLVDAAQQAASCLREIASAGPLVGPKP